MTRSHSRWLTLGAALVAVTLLSPGARIAAQEPAPYAFLMSADRLQRMATALRTKEASVPGEVLGRKGAAEVFWQSGGTR